MEVLWHLLLGSRGRSGCDFGHGSNPAGQEEDAETGGIP